MLKIIKYIRFKKEFNKKCLGTTPCQCCVYWSIRKQRCDLEYQLKNKYKII